jgi:tetratricopeptide (TPR) repeat protein
MEPENALFVNTHGVVLYRNGLYPEAESILQKSLALSNGQADDFDLFFLAMTRHKLGRPDEARADFDRAVRWWREHPQNDPWTAELNMFQAEAEQVLGNPIEQPADVFAKAP